MRPSLCYTQFGCSAIPVCLPQPFVLARCLVLDDGQTWLGIGAIPCEVFAETGLAIKQQSPFKPTFTIELANGCNGCLPTPPQHKLGGYETWRVRTSYLETEAAPKFSTP